jgi:hypothetical protein
MRLAILLFLLLSSAAYAATTSKTFTQNASYTVEGIDFVVGLGGEESIVLRNASNNLSSILKLDRCRTFTVTRICLTAASTTSATITEESLASVVTANHITDATTGEIGSDFGGTVTLSNAGELQARKVRLELQAQPGLVFDSYTDRPNQFVWEGVVSEKNVITYRAETYVNGSYSIAGNITYFDGNTTRVATVGARTYAATIPFTYEIGYDPATKAEPTKFSLNITRKNSENYTFTIKLLLPPQAKIYGMTKATSNIGENVTYKRTINVTKAGFNVTYGFTDIPSKDALVLIEYRNSTVRNTINTSLPFQIFEDNEPSLALSVDPLVENQTGNVKLIITGNRTGLLTISSKLLNESLSVGPDTYEFPIANATAGNYTLNVSFTSNNSYGGQHVAKGLVTVEVKKPLPAVPVETQPEVPVAQVNETEQPVVDQEKTTSLFLFVGIAAVSMLLILGVLIYRMRDPIAKIEKFADNVSTLRAVVEWKKRQGTATKEEVEEIASLERELQEMQKKL